jgi:hypothetical protein
VLMLFSLMEIKLPNITFGEYRWWLLLAPLKAGG